MQPVEEVIEYDLPAIHQVYIILSSPYLTRKGRRHAPKIYIGYTVNFSRRIRQHNGELVGGAKRTQQGRPWTPIAITSGFPDQHHGLSFEWHLQRMYRKKRASHHTAIQHVLDCLQRLKAKEKFATLPLTSMI